MTMVPFAQIDNLQQHQLLLLLQAGGAGYAFDHNTIMNRVHGYEYQSGAANCAGSDLASSNPMKEDQSRTDSLNDAVSTSKENNPNPNHHDDSWLQLGLGRHDDVHDHSDPITEPGRRPGELIELDLLTGGGSSQLRAARAQPPPQLPLGSFLHVPEFRAPSRTVLDSFGSSLFFQHQLMQQAAGGSSPTASFPHHHQEVGWSFRPVKGNNVTAVGSPSASSSSLMPPFGSYFARPFHVQGGMDHVAGPSNSDFRVVDPPRRPHSGIWFVLQASQNQVREAAVLPQIPKSYLRIKDGRMTVRLLMKYLVNKLRLDSESEVEITCRGQQLQPFLTLQHVRDNIWSPRDAAALGTRSTADHLNLMVLHYARTPI